MLAEVVRPVYAVGECEIDLARRELRVRGSPVPLGGRAFEIIEVLAQSAGELVTKNELMDRIWPGAIVMENTLHVHTAAVRKALGRHRGLLKTESGRGYRLLGDWSVREQDVARPPVGLQRIRVPSETPGSNFPLIVTRLVGRSAAVQRIQDLVSAYRVVTLTGPGGIGKTTLAVKVGRRILGEFGDGGWLVELASLSNPALVPSAVAGVLGLKISGEISAETVARAVGGQTLLLVLDNCEHVIDAVATLAEAFMRHCPRTTLLTTSREILRIEGEHVYRVPPLQVPGVDVKESNQILDHSAVELFIARAEVLEADFSSHTRDLPAIAAICRHLDGIPLAIEFAAARAAALGIDHVAAGLHDRFALLTSGRRTAVPRHRTLRAMLDWSYELLPEPERLLFRRLAIFSGGFTLDAAAAVMHESGLDPSGVMDGIASLVTKSLVALDQRVASTRWYLLETVRAYALEKLALHDQPDMVAQRHALHFRNRFAPTETGSETRLTNEDLIGRRREIDNVRAALDWSFSAGGDSFIGVDLTAAYALVWLHHAFNTECRERCERALLNLEPGGQNLRLRMLLQLALSSAFYASAGGSIRARTLAIDVLEAADIADDFDTQAWALMVLSAMYANSQNFAAAWAAVTRLGQIAQRSQDTAIDAIADRRKGYVQFAQGRFGEAQRSFERALRVQFATDDQQPAFWFFPVHHPSISRAMLSLTLWPQGFAERASNEARAGIDELGATAPQLSMCQTLAYGLCRTATMIGELVTAEQEIARLIDIATRLDSSFWQTVGHLLEGKLLVERREFAAALSTLRDAFAACSRTGHYYSAIEFKGALAEALAGVGQFDAALDAVDDALASAGKPDAEVWFLPELLRIKGDVLLKRDADLSAATAEDCFNQAGAVAREQGALFWELRVALSLARLRVSQGRNDEVRQILGPVYDRFTDGFWTPDLRAARAMLDTLPLV
ncbi:winged helix-turn-helix domain-containing protein [Acidisphaera sp. S103]|uniref:ATP-binding protein n=1 Tax=Acidisphaera sp. S103 TaxID=1747223 RepID=UPI00131C91E4|nr:winged helix-turn-helix domain-containing protein [Acidisphaera sp. S103]